MFTLTAFAACGGGATGSDGDAPDGDDTSDIDAFGSDRWMLTDGTADGTPLALSATHPIRLTLTREGGTPTQQGLSGTSACNSYFGSISVDVDAASVSNLGSAMMACAGQGVMELESAYLAALPRVVTADRSARGLSLPQAAPESTDRRRRTTVDWWSTGWPPPGWRARA